MNALITLFLVATFNFVLFRVMPGDPARLMLRPEGFTAAAAAKLRAEFRLDDPLWKQFAYYWVDTGRLRFGVSFAQRRPVLNVVGERIVPTVLLTGTGIGLAALFGTFIGMLAGWRRGRWLDTGTTFVGVFLYSMPIFWLGMLGIMVFSVKLGWFPTGGWGDTAAMYPDWSSMVLDRLRHLVLPACTYAMVFFGQYLIVGRTSVVGVMNDDYVLTARAKGLSDNRVLWRHVVPNALLPTVTMLMMSLGAVIGGTVLTETVFNWPGMGRLIYDSVGQRDYPVLQAVFLLTCILVILFNLIADNAYYYLDPRVKA